jgi:hypothetical protein
VPFGPEERVAPGEAIHSELLSVGFIVEGRELRVVNEPAIRVLPNPDEEAAARHAAEEQARQERAAREAAEAHAQALADELARLRAQRSEQDSKGEG